MRLLITVLFVGLAASIGAQEIDREQQLEIIENYLWVTGQLEQMPDKMAASLTLPGDDHPHAVKCGMSHILNFKLAFSRLEKDLVQQYAAALPERPTRANTYNSPSGVFQIHYNTVGTHAVYQPEQTNGQGIPLYVVKTADIFDSVYIYYRDTLGYRMPQSDGFYNGGGDGLYDIYISNVGAFGIYGQTYLDSIYANDGYLARGTSFIEIDNDFQGASFPTYHDRPLDAVRVTAAHEFFHAIHFEYDFFEAENPTSVFQRRYWMEMSAVWAEEEQYDDINDYYLLLPFFFNDPRQSLQQFRSLSDPHPYAAGIFPMYLSDTYGRDIIREIWTACDTLGAGPNFLIAAHNQILLESGLTANLATAFREFSLWNLFTGDRSTLVPVGVVGWDERENFPQYPDSMLGVYNDFDSLFLTQDTNRLNPHHLAAAYFKLDQMQAVTSNDTSYWVDAADWFSVTGDSLHVDTTCYQCRTVSCASYRILRGWTDAGVCDSLAFDSSYCSDSCEVRHPGSAPFSAIWADTSSVVRFGLGLDPGFTQPWGLSIVYQYDDKLDSLEVDRLLLPPGERSDLLYFGIPNSGIYRSVTLVLTPASPFREFFSYTIDSVYGLSLLVNEPVDPSLFDFNIDSNAISVTPSILSAYPNPAVIEQMPNPQITFRFQLPTDSISAPLFLQPFISMDIYTIAGERVMTLDSVVTATSRNLYLPTEQEVIAEISWDLTNLYGTDIASGVYIGVARLYDTGDRINVLAEEKVKVAIIR